MISQPHLSVRIQPGVSTTFQCLVKAGGQYLFFWIKVPLKGASLYIANINSLNGDVEMFGHVKNNPRINVILKKNKTTYLCGALVQRTFVEHSVTSSCILEMEARWFSKT